MSASRRVEFCRQDNVIYPAVFARGGSHRFASAEETARDRYPDPRLTIPVPYWDDMLMVGG